MKRKVLALFVAAAMTVGLVACGGGSGAGDGESDRQADVAG